MKRFLVFLFFLVPLLSHAYDAYIDGFYYDFNGDEAAVTYHYKSSYQNENAYWGDVTIPSTVTYNGKTYSVTSIGHEAFCRCSSLTSVTIPNSVTSIGYDAFSQSSLKSVVIPNSITSIGSRIFYKCQSLTSVTIPNSVTSIGSEAFFFCSGLRTLTIPNSVTSIANSAFNLCIGLMAELPDNISNIGPKAFESCKKISTGKGTLTCLALWQSGYTPYDKQENQTLLTIPRLQVTGITQTTIAAEVPESDDYTMSLSGDKVLSSVTYSNLYPDDYKNIYLYAKKGDSEWFNLGETKVTTKSLNLRVKSTGMTASSLSYKAEYDDGDANAMVSLNVVGMNTKNFEGEITGLDPNTTYAVTLSAIVKNGNGGSKTYTATETFQTKPLEVKTSQPKVITEGNVIVAAEANLSDDETNVGFEWRRTDWTDDFASNTGSAYMYNGQIEGYIRNLNANKLWKYRPYYLSDSGKYYYGDWVGLDPSNTSYFEATVHTYDKIEVEGNTALVKGYALRGTDPIKVQGFVYWKKVAGAKAMDGRMYAASVPSNAKTVEANGQIMNATLPDLDYDSEYTYVAFVTTTEGETFYGEERTFKTGENPLGINDVISDNASSEPATIIGYYDLNGRRIQTPERGIYIIRYSDGSSRKFMKK